MPRKHDDPINAFAIYYAILARGMEKCKPFFKKYCIEAEDFKNPFSRGEGIFPPLPRRGSEVEQLLEFFIQRDA